MANDPTDLTRQANYEVLKQSNAELEKYKSSLDEIVRTNKN